eukprot:TRINITY_DN448_c0_g1_i2.p1 TRINITY_DN448_c0_g1~~TRINITY_DN448_c0_g1_i2.p1  ORF type:complete len:295 (-),score=100.12 TRINITY_DN448_c0_g1_i2:148-1032(-)
MNQTQVQVENASQVNIDAQTRRAKKQNKEQEFGHLLANWKKPSASLNLVQSGKQNSGVMLFSKKSNLQLKIEGDSPIKVVIEACENCTFSIHTELMSGTLEVINSEGVNVEFYVAVPTIVIEGGKNNQVWFQSPELVTDIISCNNESLSLTPSSTSASFFVDSLGDFPALSIHPLQQLITHFVEGKLITEKVSRENGYPTTERQLTINLEREKRYEEAIMKTLTSSFQTKAPRRVGQSNNTNTNTNSITSNTNNSTNSFSIYDTKGITRTVTSFMKSALMTLAVFVAIAIKLTF